MNRHKTVIEPPSAFSFGFTEVWAYKELFYFFTWRDIKVKYKQTYLGILWALVQPLALMLLFTLVFSKNFTLHIPNVRYEPFVLSGLILWNLFQTAVANASDSIVQQANVIKKIYFPRIIIPCSSLLAAFFDFIIAFFIFIFFCLLLQQPINWLAIFLYPLAILLTLCAAMGIGTLLAALNVQYRDFRYVIPFFLQFLFFGTQVIYSLQAIQQQWLRYLLALNPLNGAIELFRIPFGFNFDKSIIVISIASAICYTFAGLFYFKKTESYFADIA